MKYPLIGALLCALAACSHHIQTSSGADYIASTGPNFIDAEIAKAAAVEPDLRFPARIGIARIVNGQLTLPPSEEIALFGDVVERNAKYGNFVPISPLVFAMMNGSSTGINQRGHQPSDAIVSNIRRAAARQHLDYVIIYEIGARSQTGNTTFALADVTLIGGMLLPTRQISVAGIGAAAFVDVRNGYPYGTTQVTADLSGFARTFQAHQRSDELRVQAALKVAKELVPNIEDMLQALSEEAT